CGCAIVAPTSAPRFSNTQTYAWAGSLQSSRDRSIQTARTRASSVGDRRPNDVSCRCVYSTTSHRPSAGPAVPASAGGVGGVARNDGKWLSKTAASYGSGTSRPPGQKGHGSSVAAAEPRGGVFRGGAMPTQAPVK